MITESHSRIPNFLPIQNTPHIPLYAENEPNTNCYLDWNSNHKNSARKAVIKALIYTAKNVCSTPEIMAKEMDYLNRVLFENNYPNNYVHP